MATKKKTGKKESKTKKTKKSEFKVIKIGDRNYEIINENRLLPQVVEAMVARGALIVEALDQARFKSYQKKDKDQPEKPTFRHDLLLGRDEGGKMMRASMSAFSNTLIVQILREKDGS